MNKHLLLLVVWLIFGFTTLLLCIAEGANPYLIAFIAWTGGLLTMTGVYEYRNAQRARRLEDLIT